MLTSDLKLLIYFNETSIYESVSKTHLVAEGSDTTVSIFSDDNGYIMKNDQYLHGEGSSFNGFHLDITDSFTINFWLYPVCPGIVTNPITGSAEAITMPVVDFVNGIHSVINISEQTTLNGKNSLKLSLSNNAYTASTVTEYDSSMWHHFWIIYDNRVVYIYIDGILSTLSETGHMPLIFNNSLLDLYVNHSLGGYAYNICKNYGYISDLALIVDYNVSTHDVGSDIQRSINYGINYVVDDSYTLTDIYSLSVYMNDPSTVTVTSAVDDMSYIYVGRNDGKILCGSPLFWECRKIYSDDNEAIAIDLPNKSEDTTIVLDNSVSDGFLKIKNKIIRL